MATKVIFEGKIYSSRAFPRGTPETTMPVLGIGAKGKYDVSIDMKMDQRYFNEFVADICRELNIDSVEMTLKGLNVVIAIE